MYTDYDKILKNGTWMQARQQVEHVSLAKLKEWRDETGEQSNEIEETFREIIVLDDDDASDDDDTTSTPDKREPSMEIVSSRATARDLQADRYIDHARVDSRTSRRMPRRTIVVQPHEAHTYERQGHSISQRPVPRPMATYTRAEVFSERARRGPVLHASCPTPDRSPMTYGTPAEAGQTTNTCSRPRASDPTMGVPRGHLQEIDGQLYHVSLSGRSGYCSRLCFFLRSQ